MSKTIKIFGKTIEQRQLILGGIATVIILVTAIFMIRFLFPASPKSTKAATPTPTIQSDNLDTDFLKEEDFQSLQESSSGNLQSGSTGRKNPFDSPASSNNETGAVINEVNQN